MHWFLAGLGGFLIFVMLWDAFTMIVLPRTITQFRPSNFFFSIFWSWWCRLALVFRGPHRRQTFYAIFGPLSVIVILGIWAFGLIVGFALLHQGLETKVHVPAGSHLDFWTLLYLSGTTFFTLGLGDVTAVSALGRTLIVLESATGFVFLAMIIGYMPVLDQSFAQREVHLLLLNSHCGSPESALQLLANLKHREGEVKLEETLESARAWLANMLESHLSHPVLAYYRSQHLGLSWLISLTVLLDICAVIIATEGEKASAQVKATFLLAINTLRELVHVLKIRPLHGRLLRLEEAHCGDLYAALNNIGIQLSQPSPAHDYFIKTRLLYEPYAQAVGQLLRIDLPHWRPKGNLPSLWPDILTALGPPPPSSR